MFDVDGIGAAPDEKDDEGVGMPCGSVNTDCVELLLSTGSGDEEDSDNVTPMFC